MSLSIASDVSAYMFQFFHRIDLPAYRMIGVCPILFRGANILQNLHGSDRIGLQVTHFDDCAR